MEEEQQQQQQQQQQQLLLHHGILNGIARLSDPLYREKRHRLRVTGNVWPRADRHSLQHLVDFLDNGDSHEVVITELELCQVGLVSDPSDGGLNVLRSFFGRSDTTLTKISLTSCNFGNEEETLQLLSTFHTNATVLDLSIGNVVNLEGAAYGLSLASLLQNMPQLQRLDGSESAWGVDGILAFQPSLQANRTLRTLNLAWCELGDDGIHLIADALVGNTTVEALDVSHNDFTSNGLDDITRILESTRLQSIDLTGDGSEDVFGNEASTRRFARVLSGHEFLKKLSLGACQITNDEFHIIVEDLVGNNTIMEVLDISTNIISSDALADITWLIDSRAPPLKVIDWDHNLFDDEDATKHFVATLVKNVTIEGLPGINARHLPGPQHRVLVTTTSIVCARNKSLNRVNVLLTPPPLPHLHRNGRSSSSLFLIKMWHKAITQFAMAGPRGGNAGASAIFKLFQARPQLLEKRIQRPAAATAAAVGGAVSRYNNHGSNNDNATNSTASSSLKVFTTNSGGQKRRRL